MKIDLIRINKELLIECIKEEIDRNNFTCNSLERQVKNHQTYGRQEDFEKILEKYILKKNYFDEIIKVIPNVNEIEETNKEYIQFWNDFIENQIEFSNKRINDWSEGGEMYESFKKRNWKDFEEGCQKLINSDINRIKCMAQLSLIISK